MDRHGSLVSCLVVTEVRSERRFAILAVSGTTFVWGWTGVLIKLTSLSALSFAMTRLWMGVLVYFVVLIGLRHRLAWRTFRTCALGGVFFGAEISLAFSAYKLTTIADATIIAALSPVLILLVAGRMFGEHVGRREAMLAGLSFVGVVLVAIGSSGSSAWSALGDLCAAGGALSWTAYWIFSKRARATVPALEYMTSVILVAAVVVTPFALAFGRVSAPEPRDWAFLVAVTLLPGATGHLLVAWSHRHLESWLSALVTQCSPVVAAAAAWIVLGQSLAPLVICGGLVVLTATCLVMVGTARRERARMAAEEFEDAVEPPA